MSVLAVTAFIRKQKRVKGRAMGEKVSRRAKDMENCHKNAIFYCIKDMKNVSNLAIISQMVQEMWRKEKSQELNQRYPSGM